MTSKGSDSRVYNQMRTKVNKTLIINHLLLYIYIYMKGKYIER